MPGSQEFPARTVPLGGRGVGYGHTDQPSALAAALAHRHKKAGV